MRTHQRFRVVLLIAFALLALVGCGGGGGTSNPPTRLVAEVFSKTSELKSAELQSNAGAAGDNTVSRAIKDSGKQHLMGLLFMFEPAADVIMASTDVAAPPFANIASPTVNSRFLGSPRQGVSNGVAGSSTSSTAEQGYVFFNSGLGDDPVLTASTAGTLTLTGTGNDVDLTNAVTFVKSTQLAPDAEQRLLQYIHDNRDLLEPGVRVLLFDEVFWNPYSSSDSVDVLQTQLDALRAGVALVRKHLPKVAIGITVTPYASFGKPNTLAFTKQVIALVDWVGTDPYWFGAPEDIAPLHDWSRSFHALAKQANPRVETWFIAQAFKFAAWDTATYNRFIAEQLSYAQHYDHIMFFGWQFVSELDPSTAGAYFTPETKRVYASYLKK